jgi:hypothetical protein
VATRITEFAGPRKRTQLASSETGGTEGNSEAALSGAGEWNSEGLVALKTRELEHVNRHPSESMDGEARLWHNGFAFVALVNPLESLKGLQVHTCGPFFWPERLETAPNSSNRKEKHS